MGKQDTLATGRRQTNQNKKIKTQKQISKKIKQKIKNTTKKQQQNICIYNISAKHAPQITAMKG